MSNDRKTSHKINEILAGSTDKLSLLYAHAHKIISLQNNLRAELPASLADHVAIANYNNNSLIILTDSPAWAARLRFKIPELLTVLRNRCGLPELKTIRIKIKVPDNDQSTPDGKLVLSNQSSNFLHNIAEMMPDPELQKSLLKISRHK